MEVEGKLILLVEDNPDEEALTLRALDRSGIDSQVVVARDGAEALDYLFGTGAYAGRDTTIMPTVTFLDLRLPKIDGLEVLRRMPADERTKLLPVVTLSSSDEKHDISTCYESKANSYIRKPVSFIEFTETVRQLGQYWMELNVPPGI
jgi:CheY-like chemotaxis protein